ncbi:glycosyltransferase family 4 protein [Marinobacter sp. SBS5]|uniref:glycosyltransferase family 4 protein n=1 Tax=Marinobacter sp. SBS5 TaxID=3401754 RepID=UPI003AAFE353
MEDGLQRKEQIFRVLLVVRWPVGGIRTFLRYVYQEIDDDRFHFTVVCADTDNSNALQHELSEVFSSWVVFPENGSEVRGCFNVVRKVLKNGDFNLVHAHGFTSAIASVLPSRLAGLPVICTSHDVLNASQFSGFSGWLKKLLLSLALYSCKIVHSVSRDAQSNLAQTLPLTLRTSQLVIQNGIQAANFSDAERVDLKADLGLSEDRVLVGFFGRFMAQKGFSVLVDAVEYVRAQNPSLGLSVVCVGSGGFIREEQLSLKKRGLVDSFHFLPFTPNIAGYLKGCDLIAMPSRWEACGLLAMEALCAGTPLVASKCIGLREVLNDTPAVLVEVGDFESLGRGIVECLEKGRRPFGDFMHEAVKRYDVKDTAGAIVKMYEQVLG